MTQQEYNDLVSGIHPFRKFIDEANANGHPFNCGELLVGQQVTGDQLDPNVENLVDQRRKGNTISF